MQPFLPLKACQRCHSQKYWNFRSHKTITNKDPDLLAVRKAPALDVPRLVWNVFMVLPDDGKMGGDQDVKVTRSLQKEPTTHLATQGPEQ